MSTKRGRLRIFALASVLVACCKRTSEPPTSSGPVPQQTRSSAPNTPVAPTAFTPTAPISDPKHGASIEALLAKRVPPDGPGVAVAVLHRGQVMHLRGYGLADREARVPVDPDTKFDLASVSKAFTATAVLRLAERGLLSLNDPASRYLPELARLDAPGRPVRVDDLLHMTSGLVEYTEEAPDTPEETLNNERLPRFAGSHPLRFPPGTKHEYVNTNYGLLACIVERISRRPFSSFLQEEIFRPAGLRTAELLVRPGQRMERRAAGYKKKHGKWAPTRDDIAVYGDGNIFASLADMVAWDQALTRAAQGAQGAVLSQASLNAAFTSGQLVSGARHGYGYGWSVGDGPAHFVDHSGGWAGTSTYIGRDLDRGWSVVLLSNDEDFDTDIADAIAALYEK